LTSVIELARPIDIGLESQKIRIDFPGRPILAPVFSPGTSTSWPQATTDLAPPGWEGNTMGNAELLHEFGKIHRQQHRLEGNVAAGLGCFAHRDDEFVKRGGHHCW
jgi:hypothetical protein